MRSILAKAACLVVVLVSSSGTSLVFAGEGRTPLFGPTTITANGKYIVTRNISCTSTSCITVAASNVDIDLNGFVLDSSVMGLSVITVATTPESLAIRNGVLRGGWYGIEAGTPTKLVVEDVRIQGQTSSGIHTAGASSVALRRNIIAYVGGNGIDIGSGQLQTTGVIEQNVIRGGGVFGIFISGASAVGLVHNRVDQTGDSGIYLYNSDGCLVSENTIEKAAVGIRLGNSSGNKLWDNVVRAALYNGIDIDQSSNDNLVAHNSATGNGTAGSGYHGLFVAGSRNFIEHNILNSNSGAGLRFAAGSAANTFYSNTARNNTGGGAGPCASGLTPPNSCDDGAGNTSGGGNLIAGPPLI